MSALYGLIELLRDPKRAQEAIKELQEALTNLNETRDHVAKDLEEAKRLHANNEVWSAENKKEAAYLKQNRADWDRDRDATSAEIQRIQEFLRNREIAAKETETALDRRQSEMEAQEKDLTERERLVAAYIEDYKAKLKEVDARLARIKEAAA